MDNKLYLYSIFHLNLAYSSIAEKDFLKIIQRCYWPLLNLIKNDGLKLGIEMSGHTLQKIQELDPKWINVFKLLLEKGKCEFVGSGYVQIISPLVPAEVNERNLKIGNEIYKSILGMAPAIAYLNEQAYSQGMVEHYLGAGYKAIVMEWNNPARWHPEWKKEWRYHSQFALDGRGRGISVIWNKSIAFQKFQRYVYGEIGLDEYLQYLKLHTGKALRFFPIYGNDAEIFNFRPGRFNTEASLAKDDEWERIRKLFKSISRSRMYVFINPSEVLTLDRSKNAFNRLRIESPEEPIPVKKQEKYNVTRWALTGRDSIGINTKCYKIYKNLKLYESQKGSLLYDTEGLWKELCFLWSSDFRTHIEIRRFKKFQRRLSWALDKSNKLIKGLVVSGVPSGDKKIKKQSKQTSIIHKGNLLEIDTSTVNIEFNCRKGLAINSLIFKKISPKPLICTLPQGYYDDISLGADYFTGHTIISISGRPQITDLEIIKSAYNKRINTNQKEILVKALIKFPFGTLRKTITVYTEEARVVFGYEIKFHNFPPASFRSAIITFNPDAFDKKSLYYACHNGGYEKEVFQLKNVSSVRNDPASFLVSSRNALGNTTGVVEIGDKEKTVMLKNNMDQCAMLPMVNYVSLPNTFFLRIPFSLGEVDETSLLSSQKRDLEIFYSLNISARREGK